ncbi:Holin-like protein CidA [Sulfurospirillum diekertiae]|jgi:holin-like protein|uniref:Holin-like protein CidA n=1 Tax=Sulfurospirillum diekertiae TaxID=1854492 RepID=A0A290HMF6_9BACT|nr:CidA/LrgA family protein [Sulfurospirillum diekertiae]ATB68898.1 Holin-like protein CidA [Sulfurospirillum diekertiae]
MLPHTFKKLLILFKHKFHKSRILQIALICALWFCAEEISLLFHIPIPGGVIGLLFVLMLLQFNILSIRSLALGAEWFLAEMLLFFIPAVPAVLNHQEFFGWTGLKILAIIIIGTIIVIIGTAFIVDFSFYKLEKHVKDENIQ